MAPFNNTVANYTKDLKNSLLLKDDMPNMLAGAPMALALLGRCKLLALSGAAAQVTMEGPFRYLKYVKLMRYRSCSSDGIPGTSHFLATLCNW